MCHWRRREVTPVGTESDGGSLRKESPTTSFPGYVRVRGFRTVSLVLSPTGVGPGPRGFEKGTR